MDKFSHYDFQQSDFDVDFVVSPVEPKRPPKEGVPLNAYKRFKKIKNGVTQYMSGQDRGY